MADHIVVVRRRRGTQLLEARLVSSRPGIPNHTTLLPAADLDDPADGGRPPRPARGRRPDRRSASEASTA